jgi:gas vesicle protein
MMSKTKRTVAVGTLVGLGLGYVAGILTAPKSGKETRKSIVDAGLKAKAEAEKKIKSLNSELNDVIQQAEKLLADAKAGAKVGLTKAVERAKLAKDEAREILSALHEGEADDKDLETAIKDAQSAIEHLKNFIVKNNTK